MNLNPGLSDLSNAGVVQCQQFHPDYYT